MIALVRVTDLNGYSIHRGHIFSNLAVLVSAVGINSGKTPLTVESRTIATRLAADKDRGTLITDRIVADSGFDLVTHTIEADGSISFSQNEFGWDGTPLRSVQVGEWANRWNHFETIYSPHHQNPLINGAKSEGNAPTSSYKNPTLLWFWKAHPKIAETCTVKFLAQIVITTFEIKFTYEGEENALVAGRNVTLHRVREDPIGSKGVYTLWWYDSAGMGVKRYHKTTEHEYFFELRAWK